MGAYFPWLWRLLLMYITVSQGLLFCSLYIPTQPKEVHTSTATKCLCQQNPELKLIIGSSPFPWAICTSIKKSLRRFMQAQGFWCSLKRAYSSALIKSHIIRLSSRSLSTMICFYGNIYIFYLLSILFFFSFFFILTIATCLLDWRKFTAVLVVPRIRAYFKNPNTGW